MKGKKPSFDEMEAFIKENRFDEKLSDFNSLWSKYKGQNVEVSSGFSVKRPGFIIGAALSAMTLLAVFFAGLLWFNFGTGHTGVLLTVSAVKDILISSGESSGWTVMQGKQALAKDSRIKTGNLSGADLSLNRVYRLSLRPDSEMKVVELSTVPGKIRSEFQLLAGKITIQTRHLNDNEKLAVTTSDLEIRVTGTKFSVQIGPEKNCQVSVAEGRVQISPSGLGAWFSEAVKLGVFNAGKTNEYFERIRSKLVLSSSESALLTANVIEKFNLQCLDMVRSSAQKKINMNGEAVMDEIALLWDNTVKKNVKIEKISENDIADFASLNGGNPAQGRTYKEVWEKKLSLDGTESESEVLPDGNFCYTGNQYLVILSPDGETVVRVKLGDRRSALTKPVVDGDRIIVGSDDGSVYAVDFRGQKIWTLKDAGIEVFNAYPVCVMDRIALPSVDKGIRLVDRNGANVISLNGQGQEAVYTTPLALKNGEVIIFGNDKGDLTGYDLKGRVQLWKKNVFQDVLVYPVIGDERSAVVLSRKTGEIAGIAPMNGKVLWRRTIDDAVKTRINPVHTEKYVFICGNNRLYVLDRMNGSVVRQGTTDTAITAVALSDNSILIGSESGQIYRYYPVSGKTENIAKLNAPVFRILSYEREIILFTAGSIVKLSQDDLES